VQAVPAVAEPVASPSFSPSPEIPKARLGSGLRSSRGGEIELATFLPRPNSYWGSAAVNSNRVPTLFWMNDSGNLAASDWLARQPVQ
jgi:hypothetical protein